MFSLKNHCCGIFFIFWCFSYLVIDFWYLWKINSLAIKGVTYFLNLFSNVNTVPKYNNIDWSSWSTWILILILSYMHKGFTFSLSKYQSSESHNFFLFNYTRYMANINSIISIINKSSLLILIATSRTLSCIAFYEIILNIFQHIFGYN